MNLIYIGLEFFIFFQSFVFSSDMSIGNWVVGILLSMWNFILSLFVITQLSQCELREHSMWWLNITDLSLFGHSWSIFHLGRVVTCIEYKWSCLSRCTWSCFPWGLEDQPCWLFHGWSFFSREHDHISI